MRTVFEVRLGAQVIATGTHGTLYFDDFESRRFSYIGTLPDSGVPVPEPPSQPGWDATNYTYDPNHVHAAITAGANTYTYDANGNTPALPGTCVQDKCAPGASVTCRVEDGVTYKQIYNAENRLSTVQLVMSGTCDSPTTIPSQWDFVYDGDGNRVKQTYTDFTTLPYTVTISSYFMGGLYEVNDGTSVKKYYGIAGMMVAMSDGGVMKYPLTDHLGSVVAVTDASGALLSQQRYLPFGQERADLGPITQTDFGYTGQRNIADIGLMDYHARMYDSLLGRFVQPDTVIPSMANPQRLDRFSYGLNNPIKYIDPDGHSSCVGEHYDDGPECATREGSQLNLEIKQKKYQDECAAGKRENCPGGTLGGLAFLAAGVFTAGTADYVFLSGGAADAAAPVVQAGYDKLLYACLLNDACRRIIGAVITPQGPAFQQNTPEALEAKEAVQNGATLYKMGQLGVSGGSESQYWSLENPMLDPAGYAQRNGIPPENVANWNMVLTGVLREGANFVTRQAPGVAPNFGGATEVVVDPFGVLIQTFTMH